jgi:H+-transporting ATPase
MRRLLGVSAILGLCSVAQSFGLLLAGFEAVAHPGHGALLGVTSRGQLQTMMFLQLVASGHLLLLVTRSERWFFRPPFPSPPLLLAIVLTQAIAVGMCARGVLIEAIPWSTIGWVWAWALAWTVIIGGARIVAERFADHRTARHLRSIDLVNRPLYPAP